MFKDFFKAVHSWIRAVRLVAELNLWGYMVVPMFISLLLGVSVFYGAWIFSDDLGGLISKIYPFDWGAEAVEKIAQVFSGLLVVVFGVLIYKHLVLVLAGPFMSPLSEKVESALTGKEFSGGWRPTKIIADIVRGLRIALRNILREIFYTVLLLLLGLIPIFSIFTTAAVFLVQAYYAGFGNLDYFLERRANVRDSIRFVRRNRMTALGNGVVFVGLLLTGIGFLFAPVVGAIAATIDGVEKSNTA